MCVNWSHAPAAASLHLSSLSVLPSSQQRSVLEEQGAATGEKKRAVRECSLMGGWPSDLAPEGLGTLLTREQTGRVARCYGVYVCVCVCRWKKVDEGYFADLKGQSVMHGTLRDIALFGYNTSSLLELHL